MSSTLAIYFDRAHDFAAQLISRHSVYLTSWNLALAQSICLGIGAGAAYYLKRRYGSTDSPQRAKANSFKLPNLDRKITLPDGRDLSYAQYGATAGQVVLHFHGFPGSRLEGALYHDAAVKLGMQVLTIDRPGVGLSSPHRDRSTLTFAEDVQCLANHLDLRSWAVMGISGGGPYALAYALLQPAGLQAVALVAAMGPHDINRSGMSRNNRVLFFCFAYCLWLVRLFGRLYMRQRGLLTEEMLVEAMPKLQKSRLPQSMKPGPKEMTVLLNENVMRTFWRSSCEFFRQGFETFCEEGRILTSDQGLQLRDLGRDLPVRLWYGKEDANVGPHMGPRVGERLGDTATLRMEGEGHASLVVNKAEDVLRDLKQFL